MTRAEASLARRTRQMRRVEVEQGEDLVELLRRLYHQEGLILEEISARINVPLGTLGGWMVRFGIDRATMSARQAAREMAAEEPTAELAS